MTDAELKRRKHAATMRQSRADAKHGLKALQGCKVDEVGHVELLLAAGFLSHSESDNWQAVGKATSELLKRLKLVHMQRNA